MIHARAGAGKNINAVTEMDDAHIYYVFQLNKLSEVPYH